MTRNTHVDPEVTRKRLEIGVDVPCHRCKMKGEVREDGKTTTCSRCKGRGFITNESASETGKEE
jgi:DnaJ-class molecular chaperone